jgi:hypothetical protein
MDSGRPTRASRHDRANLLGRLSILGAFGALGPLDRDNLRGLDFELVAFGPGRGWSRRNGGNVGASPAVTCVIL